MLFVQSKQINGKKFEQAWDTDASRAVHLPRATAPATSAAAAVSVVVDDGGSL